MGGWRQVLPGVPPRVALIQLGLSASGTDLPCIGVATTPVGRFRAEETAAWGDDPDYLGPRWVDRWGYLHRNPAGSRGSVDVPAEEWPEIHKEAA